ncbi:MAG: helix-turn-helix transcriptional regulator [Acidobacteria bacterium]|nr:helix-turn-helix transcriptional regulator [Acidobacteriota bacterium]
MFEGPVNDRPDGRLGESRELPGMRLRERVDPAGSRLPRRSHGKAFLEYVIEGCFVEECDGGRARVQSGALRYIAAGAAHAIEYPVDTRALVVELEQEMLRMAPGCGAVLQSTFDIRTPQALILARRLVTEFRERDDAAGIAIAGLVLEILAEGVRSRGSSPRHAPRWLTRARAMIDARFLEAPSLTAIADAVGVHPVHLSREFRRYFDSTVGEYTRRLRIDHASRLLASTATPLAEIAEVCGFADQSHFSSAFKRTVGLTPARFRGLHA